MDILNIFRGNQGVFDSQGIARGSHAANGKKRQKRKLARDSWFKTKKLPSLFLKARIYIFKPVFKQSTVQVYKHCLEKNLCCPWITQQAASLPHHVPSASLRSQIINSFLEANQTSPIVIKDKDKNCLIWKKNSQVTIWAPTKYWGSRMAQQINIVASKVSAMISISTFYEMEGVNTNSYTSYIQLWQL